MTARVPGCLPGRTPAYSCVTLGSHTDTRISQGGDLHWVGLGSRVLSSGLSSKMLTDSRPDTVVVFLTSTSRLFPGAQDGAASGWESAAGMGVKRQIRFLLSE